MSLMDNTHGVRVRNGQNRRGVIRRTPDINFSEHHLKRIKDVAEYKKTPAGRCKMGCKRNTSLCCVECSNFDSGMVFRVCGPHTNRHCFEHHCNISTSRR